MRTLLTVASLASTCIAYCDEQYCPFCDPRVLERQVFYEDDLVYALYTHKPIYPGHCLVIPKRHVERFHELSSQEMGQMMEVVTRVHVAVSRVFGTSPYLLLEKNGKEVGQTVDHVHFHYIPRKVGEDSTVAFIFRMFWVNMWPPIPAEEMKETVSLLRKEMEEIDSLHMPKKSA